MEDKIENGQAEQEEGTEGTKSSLHVGIDEVGPCKKLIKATVEPPRVKEGFDTAYRKLRHSAVVPGFRKGRAPRKILERRFGREIKEQVKQDLLAEAYKELLEDENLTPVGDPEFDKVEVTEDNTLTFEVTLEVRPEFEIGQYKGLKLTKSPEKVTEEDVDRGMENIRLQRAELVTEQGRRAREGDTITGDLSIFVGENVLSQQKEAVVAVRKGRVLGAEIDLPKLLKKASAGDERSTGIKLPDDFENPEFAGQEADLRIKIKEVKIQKLPEINEEFAGLMGFDSVDALREQVRRHLEARKKADAADALELQIFENLLSGAEFDLPEGLLEEQERRMKNDMRRRLHFRGVPPKVIKERLEELNGSTREESKKRIKAGFILDRIAEAEHIVATEDEVQRLIEALAADHGQKPAAVKKRMDESGLIANLRTQIRREKAVQLVLDEAEVTEEEK